VVITGANQGGKSTLLRGIGLALLMMQSGMFVTATAFRASVSTGIFTHYKREEDNTMTSGKLDEELGRISEIVGHLKPGGTVLLNESFAATNEREGSEIARQIVHALTESGVRVILVTHLFDLADGLHNEHLDTALFLRADRSTAVTAPSASPQVPPCRPATGSTFTTRCSHHTPRKNRPGCWPARSR
jgi:DNA mismatch repair ATPase MutS